ncbi:MAG: hypothetical protein IK144_02805, partial [Bacteroidaceae bacterium]|nr:hypothetical protein [Bacteroidaceae bacterium]
LYISKNRKASPCGSFCFILLISEGSIISSAVIHPILLVGDCTALFFLLGKAFRHHNGTGRKVLEK